MAGPVLGTALNAGGWDHRTYIQFGGLPVPVGNNQGAVLSYIDLNDGVSWFAQDIGLPDAHELALAQQTWRAKATYTSEDYKPLTVKVPFLYEEAVKPIFAARAQLMTAGEQVLTFDGTYGYTVKCKSLGDLKPEGNAILGDGSHLMWAGQLEFLVKEPFFKTIAQSSLLGTAVAGSSGGTATNFAVNYGGSFWAEPQWILNIPAANAATITQIKVANTTTGQTATVNCNIAGGAAHTVTIDSVGFRVTEDATELDIAGSFPMLWQGGNNNITVTITSSAATSGLTFDVKWYERWL